MLRQGRAFAIVALFAFAYGVLRLHDSWTEGGHAWQQGDWLIHAKAGLVRRGLFGSLLLRLSDLLALRPLLLTLLVQGALTLWVLVLLTDHVLRVGSERLTLLALCSPGFFVLFWVNDPGAAMRKELLVFAALACLLPAARGVRGAAAWRWLSGLVFGLAVLAHEANTLSLPFWGYGLARTRAPGAWRRDSVLAFGVLVTVAALAIALAFPRVPETGLLCPALLERGESAHLCAGAIAFLQHDVGFAMRRMAHDLEATRPFSVLVTYPLALTPVCLLLWRLGADRRQLALAIGSGVFLLPLFFLGIDWGRWIDVHVSALTFLALIELGRGATFARALPCERLVVPALWLLTPLWGLDHVFGQLRGGLVFRIMTDFGNQLGG